MSEPRIVTEEEAAEWWKHEWKAIALSYREREEALLSTRAALLDALEGSVSSYDLEFGVREPLPAWYARARDLLTKSGRTPK